jgi:hypothetical protein
MTKIEVGKRYRFNKTTLGGVYDIYTGSGYKQPEHPHFIIYEATVTKIQEMGDPIRYRGIWVKDIKWIS